VSIRVLIADDQAMVRHGFRMIVQGEPDMEVVAEAPDGEHAVASARRFTPDVVLMDIRMPRLDGLAATREILAVGAATRVLILTTFDLDEYVYDALRAGASGFLLKNAPPEELVEAIRIVARGDALLDPAITRRVIEAFAREPVVDAARLDELTPREREVLVLLARGLSNAEIASELFVGAGTVKTHVAAILAKLGLRDRTQAAIMAYESGLVRPGTSGTPGGAAG
jgi:DNA-binding NarL/FixJ family response regulator